MNTWHSGLNATEPLTEAVLQRGIQAIRDHHGSAPSFVVMSRTVNTAYADFMHTEAVRHFLGIVGPFEPITVRGTWRKLKGMVGAATYRLRKAGRVLRHGYDPEDM